MKYPLILIFFVWSLCFVHCINALPFECGSIIPPNVPPLPSVNDTLELVQVSIVFRHGDRITHNTVPCWPNDQAVYYCNNTLLSYPSYSKHQNQLKEGQLFRKNYMLGRNYFAGNCESGQLTDRGFLQLFNVGRMYKKVYIDSGFISPILNQSLIYLRSDEADRCIQSLEVLLLSMFELYDSENSWEIFDIHTMDSYYETMYPNWNVCPKYLDYVVESLNSTVYRQFYEDHMVSLFQNLSEALGYTVDNGETFYQIRDCLVVHSCHQQPIPSGITKELFTKVMAAFEYSYKILYNYPTPQLNTQSGIGFFLKEIMLPIQQRVNQWPKNEDQKKLLFYSAHDVTLVPILTSFLEWDGLWANYAYQMQFELFNNPSNSSGEFYVRVAYHGKNLKLPTCQSELCDWNSFNTFIESLFPQPTSC